MAPPASPSGSPVQQPAPPASPQPPAEAVARTASGSAGTAAAKTAFGRVVESQARVSTRRPLGATAPVPRKPSTRVGRTSSGSLGTAAAQRALKQPGVLSPRIGALRLRDSRDAPAPQQTPTALTRSTSARLGAAAARRVVVQSRVKVASRPAAPEPEPEQTAPAPTTVEALWSTRVQAEIEALTRAAASGGRRGGRRASLPDINILAVGAWPHAPPIPESLPVPPLVDLEMAQRASKGAIFH